MKHLLWLLLFAAPSHGALKVVTSTTDLAWAARAVGGDHVEVTSLLAGTENPHYVDTVPDFIRQVADASVVCIVGLELEVGWMPKVLARSGNARVQPGGPGYCEAGSGVTVLQKPSGPVDRSMGDVHPAGNPHFWLRPSSLADGARPIRDAFIRVDPAHRPDYERNYDALKARLAALEVEGKNRVQSALKGRALEVLEYHQEFAYFFEAYGLRSLGSIEEKPGVPPSAGRLAEVALMAKQAKARLALAGTFAPRKTLERFTELSGVTVHTLPLSIHRAGAPADYESLQRTLIDAVVKALEK